jgi:cytochrome c peroxidase
MPFADNVSGAREAAPPFARSRSEGVRSSRWTLMAGLASLVMVPTAAQAPVMPRAARPPIPLGLDLYLPVPSDNELTPEKVALGRRLFFDSILSQDYTMSCATCHDPRRVFADGLPRAVGIGGRSNPRHVPSLVNRAYGRTFFWDGRAASLEDQALQPIENPNELGSSVSEVVARLQEDAEYPAMFRVSFETEPNAEDLGRALASYVRTILSGDAPIDRYYAGEAVALGQEQREGLRLFLGKANCSACHVGPTFTDELFHNTGVAFRDGVLRDEGRFAATGKPEDRGEFKTPTLREVARTAPYMHDGSLATLDDVIEFYDRGGNRNPGIDDEVRPLDLSAQEERALKVFLSSLSGTVEEGRLQPVPSN